MTAKGRDELIFWFDQPPKVSLGAFNYVANNWGNKVMYISDHGYGEHRKLINWDNSDYGDAETVILSELDNEQEFIKEIFDKYPDAIHIMNGFCSTIESKIRQYVKRDGVKLVVHTEKPLGSKHSFTFEKLVRNFLTPIKYKRICKEYSAYVDAVIPLGKWGKELFESYGWDRDKVFPFMYCPILSDVNEMAHTKGEKVRFLYVGRFNYKSRGLDLLMKSFDKLADDDRWSLSLGGGYGDKKDEVISWAKNNPKVNYMGILPAETVGNVMCEHDVYIVATRADGWNSQINESLNAGSGVITSDEAVSDELIEASGAGFVVRANSVSSLYKAILKVLDNPEIVDDWRSKALEYKNRITGSSVGSYLTDILDYTFYNSGEYPICPWLNN